jgi:hypothetical protein
VPVGAHSRARRVAARALAVLAVLLVWPATAAAHGLVGRAYLPVPAWLFAWAAGIVLVVSFVALPRLWRTPRLERPGELRVCAVPKLLEPIAGAIGIAMFVVVVVGGIAGSQIPTVNLAPTAIFVLFWVGFPILSAVAGDAFAPLNPWRAVARAGAWIARRTPIARTTPPPRPYPARLGRWPAVAGVFSFAWLELVFVGRDDPATLAVMALGYALVQLVGMAWYGIEAWSSRGDGLGVAFNLFSRLAPLDWREHTLYRRRPLSGLSELPPAPGTVALITTMIGTTTFDGLANGPVWRSIAPRLVHDLTSAGLTGTAATEVTFTFGMVICILLCAGLYRLGVWGMGSVSPERHPDRQLATQFAHALAPIAFGYLLAHYFSLLATQGQAVGYLVSDPFGTGANIFGTAGFKIDYGLISAAAIWYVQVAALVGGHVSGLALAHDRALVVYADPEQAAESQRWMLVVMVTFTCLGLWLLSAVNT